VAGALGTGPGGPVHRYIALDELMACREQDVLTTEVGPAVEHGEHILQLIPEAERTPRLVETSPPEEACAHVLIEEPAIHEEIE
jgi:hypothetical protein